MTTTQSSECPFCSLNPSRIIAENEMAFVIRDLNPVSQGHSLVIPKRHVASFFELSSEEVSTIYKLLHVAKKNIDELHKPDAYNIGVNVGVTAGQTVMHVHFHVIPRYVADVPNPRGGVRTIIPGKGDYVSSSK